MRALSICLILGGLVTGVLLFRRAPASHKSEAASDSNEELAALKQEVQRLRGRVGSAEAVSAAALTRATQVDRPTETTHAASAPPPVERNLPPQTEQQRVAIFQGYFEQLDALRGSSNDPVLADRFGKTIAAHQWKQYGAEEPATTSVACGNGYCRLSLTFKALKDADIARATLPMTAMSMASGMSLFLDPDTLKVEGYFSTGDKSMPPFPGTNG